MIGLSTSDQSEETNFIPAIDADTEELSSADLSVIENLQVGSAMLLVQRGPDAGARFLLDHDSVTVGRHPSSEIFLATFVRTEQGYQVSDLGSLNGTYVNRDRIDTDVLLTGGDEVRFGKYRLIYFSGSVSGAGSAQ